MSYPGPPGVSKNTTHPSLPPRPPQAKQPGGFKPAFQPAIHSARSFSAAPSPSPAPSYPATPTTAAATSSYTATPGYGPTIGAAAPGSYGAPTPYGARQPAVPGVGGGRGGYGQANTTYGSYPQASGYQQQAAYGYGTPGNGSYSTPPQIRNPFPVPNAAPTAGHHGHHHDANYDPVEAAQIAAWQSAYMPKDPNDPNNANNKAAGAGNVPGARAGAGAYSAGAAQYGAAYGAAMDPASAAAAAAAAAAGTPTDPYAAHNANNGGATGADGEKKKTVVREGGGKKWTDDTLLEWDPSHLRLFVGNLAGETTDESLLKAFSRWKSVQKAKVVRDKRTTKSKGFGFVSFSDPEDFFQAAKEMNGKYIQSHPVVVHKAKTEIKPTVMKDDRKGGKWKDKKNSHNKEKKSGSGMGAGGAGHDGGGGGAGGGYEPHLGPAHGGGVTKPGQKTKGGLKLLG